MRGEGKKKIVRKIRVNYKSGFDPHCMDHMVSIGTSNMYQITVY